MNTEETIIAALPYAYDDENEQIKSILEQVASFCGKEFTEVKEDDPEEKKAAAKAEKEAYWAALWQVIRFISNITCWTEQADDTFIMQTRTQNYDVSQVCGCKPGCCHCDEDVIAIPLEFTPTQDEPFVSGKMTVFINGKPTVTEISAEYLNEHWDEGADKVYINRADFPDVLMFRGHCCCLCRRNVKIQLKYNAGYDMIPNGILSLICPLMTKIEESKSGLNDCANTMTQVAGALKFKKVGNIQYQWSETESNSQKTYSLYTDLFNLATVDEIYAMSRCLIAETPEEMGDVI